MALYDPTNIFAKILRGEISCHKVLENADALAFMDIMPRCDGHTLVIPKTPACDILDIASASLAALIQTVQKVAGGVRAGMQAEGLTLQQFSGSASGQVVFHIHFHILPRFSGVSLRPHTSQMEKPEILAANAAKIRAALASI